MDREVLLRQAAKQRIADEVKKRFALRLYRPHTGQVPFHRSPKRNRFLFGGNRTGKTVAGAVEAVWLATGKHPFRKRRQGLSGWVVSPTFEVQRDVSQANILKYLPAEYIVETTWREKSKGYMDRIILFVPGTGKITITFKSAEQGREAFQGSSVPWIWIDEEVPVDIYRECLMRTMDCKGDLFGTMTPLIGDLYQIVAEPEPGQEDDETWFSFITWADNPHLPDSEKKRLWDTMDEAEREARIYGRWVPKTGRVFREFRDEIHLVEPFEIPEGALRLAGFDYGLRQPTAIIWLFLHDGNAYVYDEHYYAEMTTEFHAEAIKRRGVARIKADPSTNQRGVDRKTVVGIYRQLGVNLLMAAKGDGAWEARYDMLRQLLHYERGEDGEITKPPRLFIFRDRAPSLVKELRTLRWKESRSGILHEDVQGNDHAIDALQYALEDVFAKVGPRKNPARKRNPRASYKGNRYTGY